MRFEKKLSQLQKSRENLQDILIKLKLPISIKQTRNEAAKFCTLKQKIKEVFDMLEKFFPSFSQKL